MPGSLSLRVAAAERVSSASRNQVRPDPITKLNKLDIEMKVASLTVDSKEYKYANQNEVWVVRSRG